MLLTKMTNISITMLILAATGCVSHGDLVQPVIVQPGDTSALDLGAIGPEGLLAKAWSDAKNPKGRSLEKRPAVFSDDQAKAAFKLLCSGGKPKRKVQHQFTFILPKPLPKLPLDIAQREIKTFQTWMHIEAARFYALMALAYPLGRLPDRIYDRNTESTTPMPAIGLPVFLTVDDSDASEVQQALKKASLPEVEITDFSPERCLRLLLSSYVIQTQNRRGFLAWLPRRPTSSPLALRRQRRIALIRH